MRTGSSLLETQDRQELTRVKEHLFCRKVVLTHADCHVSNIIFFRMNITFTFTLLRHNSVRRTSPFFKETEIDCIVDLVVSHTLGTLLLDNLLDPQ
jgi:hypothetical protein